MSQVLASSSSRLEGRVVIVTGGTGGLGLATCRAVVREGASLVVADLDHERLKTALGELAPLCGRDGWCSGTEGRRSLGRRCRGHGPRDARAIRPD